MTKATQKLIIQSCRWKEKVSTRPSVHKLNWLILELENLERENFDARCGELLFYQISKTASCQMKKEDQFLILLVSQHQDVYYENNLALIFD